MIELGKTLEKLRACEARVRELEGEIDYITAADHSEVQELARNLGIPPTPARVLLMLMHAKPEPLSREGIWRRLYQDRVDDWPDIDNVNQAIKALRRKGVEVGTIRNWGYYLR